MSTMDPDSNLAAQLTAAAQILAIDDEATGQDEYTREQLDDIAGAAVPLAELVQALDQWIRNGSFVPRAWMPPERDVITLAYVDGSPAS